MTNLIETRDLCRTFGSEETKVTALDHVSIDIVEGEFTAIIGPSGSGKTTLLHLIGGLDEPNSGSVTLSGSNIADMSGNQLSDFRRDHIGFIFQAYNLIPVLSAEENIEYIMLLQGISAAERKKRVKEMLAMVELEGLGDRRPSHLSGGQQQRVAVARAMASNPDIILADEALNNEWVSEVNEMRDRMKSLRAMLVQNLHDNGSPKDFSFVNDQKGMFSFLCITPEQVREVREKHSVYFVDSSRVNIAGINQENVETLAKALVSVL